MLLSPVCFRPFLEEFPTPPPLFSERSFSRKNIFKSSFGYRLLKPISNFIISVNAKDLIK